MASYTIVTQIEPVGGTNSALGSVTTETTTLSGPPGVQGDPGQGVATGGTAGQILAKVDATNYNTHWVDPAAGGGAVASVNGQTGVVVLAAADVGADAAGAAAAAQAAAIAASQPVDSDLTAIAALATTIFGRSLLTQADAAALRTTAGLGTAATAATTAFDAAGAAAAAQAASQPLDSDLTAIAALTTTSFGRSFLALADAAAGRTLLGLGTAATQASAAFDAAGAASAAQAASQPLDPDLTAIAGLVSAADKLPYFTGAGTAAVTAFTAAGRALVDDADAAAQRTTLGLGTLATQSGTFSGTSSGTNTGDQDLSTLAPKASPALTGTPTAPTAGAGTNSTQLATTAYADAKVENAVTAGHTAVAPSGDAVNTALALKAPLASPTFTGTPAAPTPAAADNSTKLATTAYVDRAAAPVPSNLLAPTGALYETFPRQQTRIDQASPGLSTGGLYLFAIALPSGLSVGHIAFVSSATASISMTHWWFGLYDSSRVQLATTADQTSAAWAANTLKSLAVATVAGGAASTFTTTYTGLHYLGIMLATSNTLPSMAGVSFSAGTGVPGLAPIVSGAADTGKTTPPAFPFTATALTVQGFSLYGYVAA